MKNGPGSEDSRPSRHGRRNLTRRAPRPAVAYGPLKLPVEREEIVTKRPTGNWVVLASAFTCFTAAHAHHSMAMFDVQKSIWLKGTVVDYAPYNPHARITLEQKGADGKIQRWVVEGPNTNRLQRMHADNSFLKPGDVIEVCGFPWRQEYAQPVANSGSPQRPAMHIHMVVMPDGHMRLFGPYGKLDNCIRPKDTTQAWVDFPERRPVGPTGLVQWPETDIGSIDRPEGICRRCQRVIGQSVRLGAELNQFSRFRNRGADVSPRSR